VGAMDWGRIWGGGQPFVASDGASSCACAARVSGEMAAVCCSTWARADAAPPSLEASEKAIAISNS
jgi:hypothetical protein